MLVKMLGWTAAAALAAAGAPALAAGAGCTASVCEDPTWPAMEVAAPAFVLEQHADTSVIQDLVASHAATDDSVTDHEETVHVHQYAALEDVLEQAEEP